MKQRFSIMAVMLLTVLMFSLTGCNSTAKDEQKSVAKGFAWEATKGDTTVNLVGTIHSAPTTHNLLNENMLNIIEKSDVLWVEVDLTSKENIKKLQESYYLESGEQLEDYLLQDEISKLTDILKSYNIKLKDVERYNSFALSSVINSLIYQEIGFTGEGLDSLLVTLANNKKVEVKEIEGVDYQIDVLSDLYTWEALQESIEIFNDEKSKAIEEGNILFEHYANGDVEASEEYEVNTKDTFGEEAYKALIVDRNIEMVQKINDNMNDGKNHTLAVGYRHFIGEDSIIKLLEDDGYTITNIN